MAAPVASSFERDPGDSLPARDRGPKGRADAPPPSFERAPGNSLPARDRGPRVGQTRRPLPQGRALPRNHVKEHAMKLAPSMEGSDRRAAPSPKDEPYPGIT